MATWENPSEVYGYRDDSKYEELCRNSKPSDFYFALSRTHSFEDGDDDGYTYIAIVPKAYFNKEKCMWDQSMYLDHILPDDCFEAMESIWECERSIDDVRQDLIARGFEENNNVVKAAREY